ncbi:anthrax toxin lethal factor-related metalloendopeptidase [Thermaerobacillus caldiproteolyticus]|uniref:anthrax toxin lethal factor-related metalloendopeptidase n=1 Tax=Thermaerobacillus caldiproteolyticus TaxID=247480 RepID=UPI0018F16E6F|nr:toxin [Anoxybacillus caldiproteolyticus]
MRRLALFVGMIMLVVPLLSFSPYPATHGVLLSASSLRLKHVPSYETLKQIIILPDTSFNHSEAKKMIKTLSHIDPPLLKKIADEHIYVKLFNGKLTNEPSARHLQGKTPRGYIYSSVTWDDVPGLGGSHLVLAKIGHSEKGRGHGSVNLELHELAHSVDYIVFDRIHETPVFLMIWQEEASRLFPHNYYLLHYPEEYFAESFAYYYYNDKTRAYLKATAPKTYQFIDHLVK